MFLLCLLYHQGTKTDREREREVRTRIQQSTSVPYFVLQKVLRTSLTLRVPLRSVKKSMADPEIGQIFTNY